MLCGDIGAVGQALATLFPPHFSEVLRQPRGMGRVQKEFGHAGATVQEQQHGMGDVGALNDQPLPDAVDLQKHPFREASGNATPTVIDQCRRLAGAPGMQKTADAQGGSAKNRRTAGDQKVAPVTPR